MNTFVAFRSGKFPPYGEDDEFIVFTDPREPVTRKLLKKVDVTVPLTRLVAAVDSILSCDPDIRDIAWSAP